MRYTINRSPPTSSSGTLIASQSGTVSLTPSSQGTTLRIIAFKAGMNDSPVHSATYYYESGNAPAQAGQASSSVSTYGANGSSGQPGYDGNGNLTEYKGWTYSYDAQNRLTSASNGTTTAEFYYDGKNRQIARKIDGWSGSARGTTGNCWRNMPEACNGSRATSRERPG